MSRRELRLKGSVNTIEIRSKEISYIGIILQARARHETRLLKLIPSQLVQVSQGEFESEPRFYFENKIQDWIKLEIQSFDSDASISFYLVDENLKAITSYELSSEQVQAQFRLHQSDLMLGWCKRYLNPFGVLGKVF